MPRDGPPNPSTSQPTQTTGNSNDSPRRLKPHRKPLDRQAGLKLEFTGGVEQAVSPLEGSGQGGQISGRQLKGFELIDQPLQRFGGTEQTLGTTGLEHHVMI